MLTQHMFQDGVIEDEFKVELEWARSRKLSMAHAFVEISSDQTSESPESCALSAVIEHYGIDRVSAAKEGRDREGIKRVECRTSLVWKAYNCCLFSHLRLLLRKHFCVVCSMWSFLWMSLYRV